MSLARQNSATDDWKTKYLHSLDELEAKERAWSALEDTLRTAIARLALAGYGPDGRLNEQLDRLRDAVKRGRDSDRVSELAQKAADLAQHRQTEPVAVTGSSGPSVEVLRNLAARLQFPAAVGREARKFSAKLANLGPDQDISPLISEFAALLDRSLTATPSGPGLIKSLFTRKAAIAEAGQAADARLSVYTNLLEGCAASEQRDTLLRRTLRPDGPDALDTIAVELSSLLDQALNSVPESADGPRVAGQWLLALLEKLPFPASFEARVESIKDQLEKPTDFAQFPPVLDSIVSLVSDVQKQIDEEKQEIENFLKGITDRIRGLDQSIRSTRQSGLDIQSEGEELRNTVRNQVSSMRSELAEADNLEQLKLSIIGSLDLVESHIVEYLERQEERAKTNQATIDTLDERLQEMRGEADDLRLRVQKAREEASRDMLTGVSNRRAFDARLQQEYARFQRYSQPLSMIVLDIDFFKRINDTYGHKAGDKALKALAGRIREAVRETDFVARYGGEEFVILMPETTRDGAYRVAEKLRQTVASVPFHYRSLPVQVTVSCGIGELRSSDQGMDDFFKRTDDALYAAKNNGRNRCEIAA